MQACRACHCVEPTCRLVKAVSSCVMMWLPVPGPLSASGCTGTCTCRSTHRGTHTPFVVISCFQHASHAICGSAGASARASAHAYSEQTCLQTLMHHATLTQMSKGFRVPLLDLYDSAMRKHSQACLLGAVWQGNSARLTVSSRVTTYTAMYQHATCVTPPVCCP
jgi:hypothetical protein